MATDRVVYEDAIGRNVAAWRAMRSLSQKDLAARMSALGLGWYPQTVGSIERSERQVTITEAVMLALALETTVPALLTPAEPFSPAAGNVVLPSGDIVTASDLHALVFNTNTHAVTWDGIRPVLKPGGYAAHPAPASATFPNPLLADPANPPTLPSGGFTRPLVFAPPLVTAIVTSSRGVLVCRHDHGTAAWAFLLGEQGQDEQPVDTITREVRQQAGLSVRPGQVISRRTEPDTGRDLIYLAARPVGGRTRVRIGEHAELAELRWASLAEAEQLIPDMLGPVRDHLARTIRAGER